MKCCKTEGRNTNVRSEFIRQPQRLAVLEHKRWSEEEELVDLESSRTPEINHGFQDRFPQSPRQSTAAGEVGVRTNNRILTWLFNPVMFLLVCECLSVTRCHLEVNAGSAQQRLFHLLPHSLNVLKNKMF